MQKKSPPSTRIRPHSRDAVHHLSTSTHLTDTLHARVRASAAAPNASRPSLPHHHRCDPAITIGGCAGAAIDFRAPAQPRVTQTA
eukprot:6211800-Pleurochrysis_carterae.AAC.3